MINMQNLAESRNEGVDQPKKTFVEENKIHRLGGMSRAQSLQEPPANISTGQQVHIKYSSSYSLNNPLYHVHQAMHRQESKTGSDQKCFQDVIREVHEMKEICEKLLTPHKDEEEEEYHQTLIMDLQKLQTNRVDLDKPQSSINESKVSIKDQITDQSKLCLHGQCDEVNAVLQKALERLEELEETNQKLKKNLVTQTALKQSAEEENARLRCKIAEIDQRQSEQIKKLRQEIEKLKKQKEHGPIQTPIFEVRRVAEESLPQKSIKKIEEPDRVPLSQVQQNLKESIVSDQSQQEVVSLASSRKMKNMVYM